MLREPRNYVHNHYDHHRPQLFSPLCSTYRCSQAIADKQSVHNAELQPSRCYLFRILLYYIRGIGIVGTI